MKALTVLAVLGLGWLDSRFVLQGRDRKAFLAYGAVFALALVMVVIEIIYYQSFKLAYIVDQIFQPLSKPVLNFLRQH